MKIKEFSNFNPGQLIEFGLNPYHWLVIEENEDEAQLMNINDPEMKFRILFDLTHKIVRIASIEWVL